MNRAKLNKVLDGTIIVLLGMHSIALGCLLADQMSKPAHAEGEPSAPVCGSCTIRRYPCSSGGWNIQYSNTAVDECQFRAQETQGRGKGWNWSGATSQSGSLPDNCPS